MRLPAIFTWAVVILACSLSANAADKLQKEFQNPPRQYTLKPLWAWNGTLTRDKLVWQIDQMVDKGVYGAFMHARAGLDESATPYFSKGFWDGVRVSVEHAHKVGFETWIYDEDKWPSGAGGGRTIAANPKRNVATGLEQKSIAVQGPVRKRIHFPDAKFVIAVRRLDDNRIDPATLTDLSELNSRSGGGDWNVPTGRWYLCVFRITHGPSELPNYINPNTIHDFLDNTYEQYASRFGKYFGTTIPGSFFDEISNIPLAWDPILAERFRKSKGYDLEKVLPLLYYNGGPKTIKVRCDYFEVFTKLYEDAWFGQIGEWCAKHHLRLTGHTLEELRNIKDQGDYFRTWRHVQVPGTDNEDFRYTFPRLIGSWKPKQLSSVCHVYGKPRAGVEALGGAGWAITLDQTRYGVNMLSVYGLNFFTFHLFHYSMDTPESMDDWPNSWFYQNPYWKYFRKLADYVRRISYMGSQGTHVADVAILYPVEDVWSEGMTDGHPVKVPDLVTPDTKDQPVTVQLVDRLVRHQIDCDLVDTDSLIQATATADGRAKIGRESYKVLVIPAVRTVSLAAWRRIGELSQKGLKVVALGATPRNSAENGADDPEVIRISRELFPHGPVPDGGQLLTTLRSDIQPDVQVLSGPVQQLRYLHRRIGSDDTYWLVNSERSPAQWTIRFAATGSVQRWDPETGDAMTVPVLDRSAGSTTLRLSFQPWEAYYIVLNHDEQPAAIRAQNPPPASSLPSLAVNGPWTFQLAPKVLDYVWKPDPGETHVDLPVMQMRIERHPSGPDVLWRRIKITDTLDPKKGAARYLSPWDAFWITRYVYHDFPGELAGPDLHFSKTIDVPFAPSGASLTLAADAQFELRVNGVKVASGAYSASPVTLKSLHLRQGRNSIDVLVKGAGYLLAQGEVRGTDGRRLAIRTDRTWQVQAPKTQPIAAYEFAFPPFGKWGDIPLGNRRQSLPAVVWYRGVVPPGADTLERPSVRGRYELFLNGRPLAIPQDGSIPLPARLAPNTVISIKAGVEHPEDGLQAPLAFRCGRAPVTLGDWQKLGLNWYSGRAIYRTTFDLPKSYAGRKLVLKLGDLRYTGEVWLNGHLVNSLAWPPYNVDISRFAKEGSNQLVVVVANLMANEARWDIFDSVISKQFDRWWHDGNILREAGHLRSGLLGPVRVEVAQP